KAQQKHGLVLMIIDALDEMDSSGEKVNFLPENLPAGVKAILSCRPEIPLINALKRRLRKLVFEQLPPLRAKDLPLFLEKYLESARINELNNKVDFKTLFKHTGGNSLFLQRAMERIVEEVDRAHKHQAPLPIIDVTVFPNTIDAVFED